jgi:lipopolysaccharide heptosyltransferase II
LRIATMKAVDTHAGRLLCAALGLVRRARPKPLPGAGDPSVRRIAIVKFWGMGSIVLMTPAIALLREKYPGAKLTFVTQAANQDVIRLLSDVDDMLLLEVGRGPAAFLASLARLVRDVRARAFDLWVDAEFVTRFSALLTGVSGARTAAGFHVPEVDRGAFHHVRHPFNGHWHMIDNFAALAAGDLEPVSFHRPLAAIRPTPEAQSAVGTKLAARGLALGEPYVVINPNAGELALERRWSVERFARLADDLLEGFPGKVVTVGAPAERAYVARMLEGVRARDRVIDLSGETSLPELVALFAEARGMVSNDTGPLHLACAVGTPTVAIFGPETPVLFGPRGPQHRIVYRGLACSPCLGVHNGRTVSCPYRTTHCVDGIAVAEVLAAARAMLEAGEAAGSAAPAAAG